MDQTTIPSGLLSHILLAQAVRQKQVVAGHRGRSTMKPLLVLLFAVLIVDSRAVAGLATDIAQTNQVILSAGSWKPSLEETQKALAAIQVFLDKPSSTNDWTKSEIKKIREHTKKYRVQFMGVVREGRRVIWCNFFPAPRKDEKDHFQEWKQQEIMVDDGGFWFWQIDYDPSTGKCSKFTSNGYA